MIKSFYPSLQVLETILCSPTLASEHIHHALPQLLNTMQTNSTFFEETSGCIKILLRYGERAPRVLPSLLITLATLLHIYII